MKRRAAIIATVAALTIALGFWLAGVSFGTPENSQAPAFTDGMRQAEKVITGDLLHAHTAFLSDDMLEGRGPGTRGGELAQKYIAAQFERLGFKPAGDAGTWFQRFPLIGRTVVSKSNLTVRGNGQTKTFKYRDEFIPSSEKEDEKVSVDADLVFVGYGIEAPEYNWNDFKGMDVKGKILIELVNDPPATPDEPNLFGGKAMTYYGRWTYKYEEGARLGAAGVILIHTTESAGYPFTVVQTSWTTEDLKLPRRPDAPPPLALQAWITNDAARELFKLAGKDLDELRRAAASRDFEPVALGLTGSTEMTQVVRRDTQTANVIGILPGSDPELKDEYVVYTAHFDHLGKGSGEGDQIYNGAADNAIGVAALLSIAEAMAALPGGPARSQIFAAVGAEEQGLLGSQYYAENPAIPSVQTVANINMDGLVTWGSTRDIIQIGLGKSDLDQVAEIVAQRNNLRIDPDQFPEKGFFYRSDQFNLAKIGVPALYFDAGLDVIGKPEGYGRKKFEEYTAHDYHQPSDEIKPDWDWGGAQQMARYLFEVGWLASTWNREFNWYPSAEFRAAREDAQRKAKEEQ